jgi:hypothetical protein
MYVSSQEINKRALPIPITKSRGEGVLIFYMLLQMFHCRFAIAIRVFVVV